MKQIDSRDNDIRATYFDIHPFVERGTYHIGKLYVWHWVRRMWRGDAQKPYDHYVDNP